MQKLTIVTHGMRKDSKVQGAAHADEIYSVALLLAMLNPTEFVVYRRDPTPEELEDPDVWVLDVGMRLEPAKHNFDHHQLDNGHCAFTLLLDYFGLKDKFSTLYPWVDALAVRDVNGPLAMEQYLGAPSNTSAQIPNAGERLLITEFGQCDYIDDATMIGKMLRSISAYWYHELDCIFNWLDKNVSQLKVMQFGTMKALIVPMTVEPRYRAITIYRNKYRPDIGLSCGLDETNQDSLKFYRWDNMAGIDFRKIKLTEEQQLHYKIVFVHNSGFMAIIKWLSPEAKSQIGKHMVQWLSQATDGSFDGIENLETESE